uniref:Uncharacterized protein n=1 Tax=Romanomermis culicivorax TaxID=13658 RepID=A0A915IF12_ROMCU
MIYVLHGRGCIFGSIAPGASLCVVATAEVVLAVAVEKRQIYGAEAVPIFAGGNQLKVCSCDSGPVIGPCYGDCQKGD